MAQLIDGKKHAQAIFTRIFDYTQQLVKATNCTPSLAVILVGDDKASNIYIKAKKRKAESCGFSINIHRFKADIEQEKLINFIQELNHDPATNAILLQLPLPAGLNSQILCQTIDPAKDVDGFNYVNAGHLWYNGLAAYATNTAFLPCTPLAIMQLIQNIHGSDLNQLDAVIVGRSNIVGRPVAALLLAANATITIAHRKTRGLEEVCSSADILIAAAGSPQLIGKDYIKPGATIIDVGINRHESNGIVGDVNFQAAIKLARFITPVPGGVGPMTIAMLMYNTLKAACIQTNYPSLSLTELSG